MYVHLCTYHTIPGQPYTVAITSTSTTCSLARCCRKPSLFERWHGVWCSRCGGWKTRAPGEKPPPKGSFERESYPKWPKHSGSGFVSNCPEISSIFRCLVFLSSNDRRVGQLPIVFRDKLGELKFTGNSIIITLVPQPVCCMHLNDEHIYTQTSWFLVQTLPSGVIGSRAFPMPGMAPERPDPGHWLLLLGDLWKLTTV